jgi:hypothetical protein
MPSLIPRYFNYQGFLLIKNVDSTLTVPTALIAQEAEEESESIDLSKRDDQEKKQRKKRKGLYGAKHNGNQPA